MNAISLDRYEYRYPESTRAALSVNRLAIPEGAFVLLMGPSGGGKTTLLRVLGGLCPRFHGGDATGTIELFGKRIEEYSHRELCRSVGSVFQDPESQLFMTRVEREVGFGLQNIEVDTQSIPRQVAEALAIFGITHLDGREVRSLSGGEKQKLAVASVLAMRPRILLLDEPTSQLDPVASDELLRLLKRVNEDLGLSIVLSEHNIDRCFGMADTVLYCANGEVTDIGRPSDAAKWLFEQGLEPPSLARLFSQSGRPELPLSLKEARAALGSEPGALLSESKMASGSLSADGSGFGVGAVRSTEDSEEHRSAEPVFRLRNVSYVYGTPKQKRRGHTDPTLSGLTFAVSAGEFVALVGENGAGKSTLLRLMAGLLEPTEGRLEHIVAENSFGSGLDVALLSQNPNDHLTENSVRLQMERALRLAGRTWGFEEDAVLREFGLAGLVSSNPLDLSSGERQRVALLSVLLGGAQTLLLDEPTRGMDPSTRRLLGRTLRKQAAKGRVVVLVTHDIELVAEHASRVVLLSRGKVVADGDARDVLDGALYYSPVVNRLFPGVIRYNEALSVLRSVSHDCS